MKLNRVWRRVAITLCNRLAEKCWLPTNLTSEIRIAGPSVTWKVPTAVLLGPGMLEKVHAVDSLDVLIDDRIVKRLAYARGNMERNCIVLDALVADDADFGDKRTGRLRVRVRETQQ